MSQAHKTSEPAAPLHSILRELDQQWEKDHQVTLSVGGRAFVVRHQKTYDRLCSVIDTLETLEGVERGLEDLKHGRVRTLAEFDARMRQKYGISD